MMLIILCFISGLLGAMTYEWIKKKKKSPFIQKGFDLVSDPIESPIEKSSIYYRSDEVIADEEEKKEKQNAL